MVSLYYLYINIHIPVRHQVPFLYLPHLLPQVLSILSDHCPRKKCSDPPRCKPGDPVNHEASAGAENPSLRDPSTETENRFMEPKY